MTRLPEKNLCDERLPLPADPELALLDDPEQPLELVVGAALGAPRQRLDHVPRRALHASALVRELRAGREVGSADLVEHGAVGVQKEARGRAAPVEVAGTFELEEDVSRGKHKDGRKLSLITWLVYDSQVASRKVALSASAVDKSWSANN